jgi:hypothetical protein
VDLNFSIGVNTKDAAHLLPALLHARKQLTLAPFSPGSLKHLLPVRKTSVSSHEVIERIRRHVVLAFDTACFEECAARLKVSVLPNEIIRPVNLSPSTCARRQVSQGSVQVCEVLNHQI